MDKSAHKPWGIFLFWKQERWLTTDSNHFKFSCHPFSIRCVKIIELPCHMLPLMRIKLAMLSRFQHPPIQAHSESHQAHQLPDETELD